MRVSLNTRFSEGCRGVHVLAGSHQQPHAARGPLSCPWVHANDTASHGTLAKCRTRTGGRARAVTQETCSRPLRRTAKTTLFYTKPKEAPQYCNPAQSSSTGSHAAYTAPSSDVEMGSAVQQPPDPAASDLTCVRVDGQEATVTPSPVLSAAHSGASEQSYVDTDPQVPARTVDVGKRAHGTAQQDSLQQPVAGGSVHRDVPSIKLPSRVRRPWDQVPQPSLQPVTLSEGGRQHRKAHATNTPDSHQEDVSSVYTYLRSRGLSELQAERLALELDGESSQFADAAALREQLCKLDRLLPGLNVNVLLCKDSLILTTDTSTAAARLVNLHSLLGSPNLVSLLHVAPQLLYADDVEERVEQCITRLMALLPEDYDIKKLHRLLAEAPTIIFRMDHFGKEDDITSLHDLPADLVHRLTGPDSLQDDACMSCLI